MPRFDGGSGWGEAIAELSLVKLVRPIIREGYEFGPGTLGVVVFAYRNGLAFEVEFTEPTHAVVTVDAVDLIAVPPDTVR